MAKKIPALVLDKLRFVGWKKYDGNNPMYFENWVKDGVAIKIDPSQSMGRMYHLNVMWPTGKTTHHYIHEPVLLDAIEKKGKVSEPRRTN